MDKKKPEQQNVALFIDGENVSSKKAEIIMAKAKQQGKVESSKVYALQKDEHTKGWTDKAKELGIKGIRLYGSPEKDKVDKKLQKDAKQKGNADIVCIAASDGGYADSVKELREQGKKVVIIGESKTPDKLRKACDKFVEI